jgi:hypothetical protein
VSERPADPAANVPEAVAGVSQAHDKGGPAPAAPCGPAAFSYKSVRRASRVRPYNRRANDPLYRPLRIFSLDPSHPKLEGAVALLKVPYEPLTPGPVGHLFEVDNRDLQRAVRYARVDLDEPKLLMTNGRDPSPSDVQFHQQMVYAVASNVYAAFKGALGRDIAWGFEDPAGEAGAPSDPKDPAFALRLRLIPHAMKDKNAYYSPKTGEIRFGYYPAKADVDAKNTRGGYVFTCLSHDIIAHELTHALLHGLRGQSLIPTNPDVLAFHEAFSDIVAIFQHFTYPEVVAAAIAQSGGRLDRAAMLGDIARQFGYTAGNEGDKERKALRSAIDLTKPDETPSTSYDPTLEVHKLGSVLVSAVFEAFTTLFRRKTERYVRLATNGSGTLPAGALPHDLQRVLADQASQLAGQILGLCIRAIDYCPPVDIEFGDYLRALITADAELVADDPWAYREALVNAFGRRGIFPRDVSNLAEDSLRWHPAWRPITIERLHFANIHFAGDPALAADPEELEKQAAALAEKVTDQRYFEAFGLALPDGKEFMDPVVQSIRTARRVGPNGQVLFDLVAEVTQERVVDGFPPFCGGATVIVGPEGTVRYVIVKNVKNARRLREYEEYVRTKGKPISTEGGVSDDIFRLVHELADKTSDARPV